MTDALLGKSVISNDSTLLGPAVLRQSFINEEKDETELRGEEAVEGDEEIPAVRLSRSTLYIYITITR